MKTKRNKKGAKINAIEIKNLDVLLKIITIGLLNVRNCSRKNGRNIINATRLLFTEITLWE